MCVCVHINMQVPGSWNKLEKIVQREFVISPLPSPVELKSPHYAYTHTHTTSNLPASCLAGMY